ncbi:nucleotidyltransferase family protein [Hyphomonas sp. NPDC076900]|uniref:nucleotidyltransferase family protein n=1 Tax=unclassified Hyphomonas TaxID=2630699 RepID=UPI003CFFA592
MRQIPLTLQTLYQDLLQAHLDRPLEDLVGTPHLRKVGGKSWWYATVRGAGGAHRQQFIGPDTPDTAARISAWKTNARDMRAFRHQASEKARALRAARMPALDVQTGKTLRALAQAGTFRLGGVLVGTHAFRLYDLELGLSVSSGAAAITADIDVAAFEKLSLAINDHAEPELPEVLDGLGLKPVEGLSRGKPVRWRQPGSDFVIDFLSPSFGQSEGPQKLEAFGLWAQGLHFLNFLLRDPIPAVALYREGVLVQIPLPERYAVHKLIVASRRRGPGQAKAEKDLLQARLLIEALKEARPGDVFAALREARKEGPAWREAIDNSLNRAPDIARLLRRN